MSFPWGLFARKAARVFFFSWAALRWQRQTIALPYRVATLPVPQNAQAEPV